ncbi:rossmann-fold nad (+)-binding protein [Ophiostoma piceae UAMH 11346]|uniref:Rossmann-fold nad (+)-binding protein n=1 Tax=Ophiostoma piceae (strain UAMH 11346) TaxID=1262450 RepID=S3CTI0_OPHP1|nr:rossmann-fold nad (+)-binding protein [Ophiostoma piceae UAMH 11346]
MTTMDIDQRSEVSQELVLKYAQVRHQETLVAKDEDVRRQKVRVALLIEENGRLKNHASQLDSRVEVLAAQYEDAQLKADSLDQKVREQENQLRAKAREYASLRTELMSLNNATHDSTKVLTEKLALTRELAMLKPEVDHLRSQLTHQKEVLAEKLALERQLNTVEVELANEKRAAQRTAERQTSDGNEAEEGLKQKIQDLEKKLAAEKRAREKVQNELEARGEENTGNSEAATAKLQGRLKELEKSLADEKRESQRAKKTLETEVAEARGQIDVFEQRVDDLKSKLREVREELKGARAELSAAETSGIQDKPARGGVSIPTKEGGAPVKKTKAVSKKRRAEEPGGPELMLQTPGVSNEGRAKRPLKKRGFDPSAASELPEDSIMGRRISASGATLASVDISESSTPSIAAKATGNEAPKRRGRPAKDKALGEAPVSKKNLKAQAAKTDSVSAVEAPAKKAPVQASAIDETSTEQENRLPPTAAAPKAVALKEKKSAAAVTKLTAEAEPKKKKRKILGASSKTVFDEDDDNGDQEDMVAARPIKPAAAAVSTAAGAGVKRTVKALGGAGRATGGPVNKRTMLGGMRNAFGGAAGGGFSPLKRERRGVNASFLA